jgi:hypothetical protein
MWRMRIAYRITKAKNTHSEYVIFIAFPRQPWLRESASRLRLYVLCLSCVIRCGRPSIELIRQFPLLPLSSVTKSTLFTSTNCLCYVCNTSFIRIYKQTASNVRRIPLWITCIALRSEYLVIHFVRPEKWVTASNKGLALLLLLLLLLLPATWMGRSELRMCKPLDVQTEPCKTYRPLIESCFTALPAAHQVI